MNTEEQRTIQSTSRTESSGPNSAALPLAQTLLTKAFSRPRDPRSPEFKAGTRAALEFRLACTPIRIPFALGTAQADAFFAGLLEGHAIWRAHVEQNEAEGT